MDVFVVRTLSPAKGKDEGGCSLRLVICILEAAFLGYRDSIGKFKFGSVVYGIAIIMYMHAVEILADFNLAVERHTTKSPNLIPCQFFPSIQ